MSEAVLVTGGSGFIGVEVAQYLLRQGHRVVCLDRLFDDVRLGRIDGQVERVEGDVRDAALVDSLVARSDRVIHLAAVVGVDEYLRRPLEVLDVNILGTRNVLLACTRHGRPVVFASTSEVYGKNAGTLDESKDRVYGPAHNNRWSYAISKSACEQYAYALANQGLIFSAVRYFNVYGPHLDAPGRGRVISKFLGRIQAAKPLELVDGGHAVRCLCYVEDAAEATARLAVSLDAGTSFCDRSINIGRAEPMSMRCLAQLMIELSGHTAGIEEVAGVDHFGPGFEEIPHRVPDVEFLHEAIGFRARVDARTGLMRTLDHWGLLRTDLAEAPRGRAPSLPPIPEIRPLFEPTPQLLRTFHRILESGKVTNGGPHVHRLEAQAASYLGVEDVVATSTGTDALTLILRALGLRGKAVLPAFTFMATLNAVVAVGLEPVLCDIDEQTFTLDPGALGALLARETQVSVVLPVNVFGVVPNLPAIAMLARQAGAQLVYDNAHGFGAEVDGRRAPPEPVAQMFSLHATKVLSAVEGGLVVGADPSLLAAVRCLRNHGLADDPLRSTPGMNAKMDELRAATGSHSLLSFPEALARRRAYGTRLTVGLAVDGLSDHFTPQRIPTNVRTNYQNLGVRCSAAEHVGLRAVLDAFKAEGIGCRSYFHPPLHRLEMFQNRFELPVTDRVSRSLLCFPIHNRMSEQDLERIGASFAAVASTFDAANEPTLLVPAQSR